MMRFFWTVLLPVSATGACATVLLWLTRPLLHRMGRMHWPVNAVVVVLCLFVIPVFLFAPGFPAAARPEPAPAAMTASPAPQDVLGSGAASPSAAPFMTDASGSVLSSAADGTPSANAVAGAANTGEPAPAGNGGAMADALLLFLRVMPLFWAAGMALALLSNTVSYLRFAVRLNRSSRAVTDAAVLGSLQAAQKKSGAARLPGLRQTEAIASPLAMGILRPCIYLPAGIPADASLDYALQHECVHLHKGHLFWKFAAQLVCAVHWFDPTVWLLAHLLNEACEFECDRTVAAALDGAQKCEYCTALLDAADSGRVPRCVSAFSRPAVILRKRIEAVLAPKARLSQRIVSAALCASLVFSAAGLTACAAGQAADSASELLPLPQPASAPEEDLPQQGDPGPAGASDQGNNVQPLQSGIGASESGEASEEWVWPVPNMRYLTTRFSENGHHGVDIAAAKDEAIFAVRGGTVTIAGYEEAQWSYGNYVEIDHGNGMKSRYAHCDAVLVQAGDVVAAGQEIARVGCTGVSTGNHCHLELLVNDTWIDPLLLVHPPLGDADEAAWIPAAAAIQETDIQYSVAHAYETTNYFPGVLEILGKEYSSEEWDRFDQDAHYWQASFRKPVTVLNEQKGEAFVTLTLCEYEGNIYICDVLQCGFTETEGWERVSNIWVQVVNSADAQKPPEVTISASFLNGNETKSTLITSTFVPTASEGEWGYAPQE